MMQQMTVVTNKRIAYLKIDSVANPIVIINMAVCFVALIHDPAGYGGIAHAGAALANGAGC